jgi:hypothetical protein
MRENRLPLQKILIAAVLAVLAAVLFLMNSSTPVAPEEREREVRKDIRSVAEIIDTVFARYGIGPERVRTWRVKTPGGAFSRLQRRVTVTPSFVSVKFNHELNGELEGTGTRVVGTERTKENSVTTHIKRGSTIIESITFVVERPPRIPATRGKEHRHQ